MQYNMNNFKKLFYLLVWSATTAVLFTGMLGVAFDAESYLETNPYEESGFLWNGDSNIDAGTETIE